MLKRDKRCGKGKTRKSRFTPSAWDERMKNVNDPNASWLKFLLPACEIDKILSRKARQLRKSDKVFLASMPQIMLIYGSPLILPKENPTKDNRIRLWKKECERPTKRQFIKDSTSNKVSARCFHHDRNSKVEIEEKEHTTDGASL